MALLGTPNAFLGVDIGTSAIKMVELIVRSHRREITTYAHATAPNLLAALAIPRKQAVEKTVATIAHMMEKAGTSADIIGLALPASAVFTTVVEIPAVSSSDMDRAVRFAARNLIPTKPKETIVMWNRQDSSRAPLPMKMKVPIRQAATSTSEAAAPSGSMQSTPQSREKNISVVVIALPQELLQRYQDVADALHMELGVLEAEAFPLLHSVLSGQSDTALVCDIGDRVTTFYIVEKDMMVTTHTIEYGGYHITQALANALNLSMAEAKQKKQQLSKARSLDPSARHIIESALEVIVKRAQLLLGQYEKRAPKTLTKTILAGGGAILMGLKETWMKTTNHKVVFANPWRGLSYPQELETKLRSLGPMYAIAVGLVQRLAQSELLD